MKVSCRICSIADLHPTFSFMTTAEISFYQTRNISEKNFSQKKGILCMALIITSKSGFFLNLT